MVAALQGTVVACDVPTKEFIVYLDEKAIPKDKFILQVLDDTQVFIKSDSLTWVTQQIDKWQRTNSYEPV